MEEDDDEDKNGKDQDEGEEEVKTKEEEKEDEEEELTKTMSGCRGALSSLWWRLLFVMVISRSFSIHSSSSLLLAL